MPFTTSSDTDGITYHAGTAMRALPAAVARIQRAGIRAASARLPRRRPARCRFYLLGSLALGAKSKDPSTALKAALGLAEHLHQTPMNAGFPVRRVDAALVRRVQPLVSDQDAQVIAAATARSRGVALEASAPVASTLRSRVMDPLLGGRATLEAVIGEASAALEAALRTQTAISRL